MLNIDCLPLFLFIPLRCISSGGSPTSFYPSLLSSLLSNPSRATIKHSMLGHCMTANGAATSVHQVSLLKNTFIRCVCVCVCVSFNVLPFTGQHLVGRCTGQNSPTQCADCASGYYSDSYNFNIGCKSCDGCSMSGECVWVSIHFQQNMICTDTCLVCLSKTVTHLFF